MEIRIPPGQILVLLVREGPEGVREVRLMPLERAVPLVWPYINGREGGDGCERPFPSSWGFYSEPSS